ncbi:DUF1800 domain-containing protein [Pedobacter alpinus]|uniref:DUF1800 domain-containing protein n=1 Tax=Pedobacter alpinus TaxID=1590643 RepID=A0ABW5TUZ3_9SPHI
MKAVIKYFYVPFCAIGIIFFLSSFLAKDNDITKAYQKAGLTEKHAALHLLSRFTYGAKPNEIDEILKMGLDNWFNNQLNAKIADEELSSKLKSYDAINLSNLEVSETFPQGAKVLRMAIKDGFIDKDSVKVGDNKKEYRDKILSYMETKGLRPQQELFRQFISQKILRATYSNNQLQEVLTDFWFNHFNVSLTKNECAMYIPAYERDVIRPNVLGKFKTMLLASAKSPAMLFYLDNFSSASNNQSDGAIMEMMGMNAKSEKAKAAIQKIKANKKNQGLNENYAREVMELHTLGVDGGYTQDDVTQAARVLTGWTIYPFDDYGGGAALKKMIDKIGEGNLVKRGFVHDGDFLFAINRHDTGDKVVLGKKFDGSLGYQEGVDLLNMLAQHPSTAKFISKKLATKFVNDNPAQSLINKMAKTFSDTNGDIKAVLKTMTASPEFWNKEALGEKTKSPFELAISAVRALDADVVQPYQLYSWINKMGQKIYYYQAPTGFPDKGQYWINTGALLNRMNFGLALASQKIPGVRINLSKLNDNHEPESSEAALKTYSKIILPERDLTKTVERLTPFLNDPNLLNKVEQAANKNKPATSMANTEDEDTMMAVGAVKKPQTVQKNKQNNMANNTMLAQVVGVIIGAPEFQKR